MVNFGINIENVISFAALFISLYAIVITSRFNKKQEKIFETQQKINESAIEKDGQENERSKKAVLGVAFVNVGNNNYRLKIFNKGMSQARDVKIIFLEENDIFIDSDVNEKFPLEVFEPHQYVELIAAVCMGSKRKYSIKLVWEDDFSKNNESTFYPTI